MDEREKEKENPLGDVLREIREISEKVSRIERVQEEDSRMIRALHLSMRINRAFRIVYIVVVLSILFGVYYYIQPYIDKMLEIYNQLYSSPVNVGSPVDLLNKVLTP